tara:strand:+ start:119 stop:292 length:174 start_codon:yes stop_codon:yes gene_type:complete
MRKDFFNIRDIKDFFRLLTFFIVSPIIGIVMLVGMVGTSVAMVCMYVKDFIMERFYE